MLKRVISALVLIAVIALCYVGWNSYRQKRAMMTGEVLGGPTGGSDSLNERSTPPPASDLVQSKPTLFPPVKTQGERATVPQANAPASDSMTPNPPNGMAYAGSGHFQVYRQGNLTYRLNTDTGQTCILYATNEEWRKPQVYTHGCASTSAQ